jgi:hypothetical protein
MGEAYLLDTSAVSKYLRGKLPEDVLDFMDSVLYVPANLSVIARIELEVFNPPTRQERKQFIDFVRESVIYDLSEEVILQTVKLRRHYKGLKLPDAIIAATAIVSDFTLLSTNDSDFEKITGLKFRSLTA